MVEGTAVLRCAGFLVVFLASPSASAFLPRGHEIIEAAAYRALMERKAVAGVSGKEIVAYLIRQHVLTEPRCFDDDADDSTCGDDARRTRPVDFWPVLGSGSPDLLQSRQFGPRGQCYHFMADSRDWRRTARDPATGATVGMTRDAHARCIRLVTSLFDETLRNAYTASRRGRGTYVLMHAIADSYSGAHTDRGADGTGAIRYLKVWLLRTFLSYPFDARHFDRRFHHKLVDSRDGDFIDPDRLVGGKRCGDHEAAYEVPLDCLTAEARAATDATVDLLVTIYLALRDRAAASDGSVSIDDASAKQHLTAFLGRRLASTAAPLVVERQRDGEHDWEPNLMVAARLRPALDGNEWEAGVTVAAMRVVRRAVPLVPLAAVTLGYGRFAGEGRLLARAEMSFLMPIWDYFGIGLSPIVAGVGCAPDLSDCHGDLITLPARLSLFWSRGVWIDLSGPEYSWVDRAWNNRVALTIGAAFDRVSSRRPEPHVRWSDAGAPWDPPPLGSVLLRKSPAALSFFVEGDLWSSDADRLLAAGVGVRRERDRHGRRAGFGLAADLSYQRGRVGGLRLDDARLAPMATYYLLPATLALRLAPLTFAIGRWGDDLYLDLGVSAQLDLSISAFEVSLSTPRLSYVHRGENRGTPIALRFTWRIAD